MQEIERTALWVAGIRALETERDNALFKDPFARRLAGEDGVEGLRQSFANGCSLPPAIEVRTRWLDDQIALSLSGGMRQAVIVGAGLDARTYRLSWPAGTRVFEVDHPEILAYKANKLADATPSCDFISVAADLREGWPETLAMNGFDAQRPTLWLAEGLLCYFKAEHVHALLARIDSLSAPGSLLLADILGRSMLDSAGAGLLHSMAREFGTDEPEALLEPLGWKTHAHLISAVGKGLGRWPYPVRERGTPGVPQSFVVHAVKR